MGDFNKQALVDFIASTGATVAEARMIVDLSLHAAEEAIKTVERVTGTAPTELIRQGAYMATLKYLQVNIEAAMERKCHPIPWPQVAQLQRPRVLYLQMRTRLLHALPWCRRDVADRLPWGSDGSRHTGSGDCW